MSTDLRVGKSCQVKIGEKTYTGQIGSIGKYPYNTCTCIIFLVLVSVYITDMPIQLKFDMLYTGAVTEMKDYEKQFEDGQWLPFDKVLEDATNRVVTVNKVVLYVFFHPTILFVYMSLVYLGN